MREVGTGSEGGWHGKNTMQLVDFNNVFSFSFFALIFI